MKRVRMELDPTTVLSTFGHRLVDEIGVPEQTLNMLFSALFLTGLGTFIGGNLLLLNAEVLWHSALVTLPSLGLILVFYTMSRLLGSLPWGLVLTYSALMGMVYARRPEVDFIVYTLCVASAIYTVLHFRLEQRCWLVVVLMAVAGTALVLGVSNAYTSFDMLHRLHLGNVNQDTLFHASIAAMLKNYGVMTTGLHGLVETPYHGLSHALMAGLSRLSGIGVIEVYGVATWVMFAPLLLFSIVAFIVMIDRDGRLSIPVIWACSAMLLSVLPMLFSRWAVWDSFFVSESYLISLGLLLLSFSLLFKRHIAMFDILLVVIAAAFIASAKASVGLIFAGLWLVRLVFLPGDSSLRVLVASLLLFTAVGLSVIEASRAASGTMPISPLHFIRSFSPWGYHLNEAVGALFSNEIPKFKTLALGVAALIGFVWIHFLVSWVVVLQAGRRGLGWLLRSPIALYSLAAMSAGFAVLLIFDIPGGSAYYFSNVALFISLPAFVAMWADSWQRWGRGHYLLLGLSVIIIAVTGWPAYVRHSILSPASFPASNNPMISHLLKLKANSPLNLVLRPSAELLEGNPVVPCEAQPFVFPAVSERPWINVIQDVAGCNYRYYGYENYGLVSGGQHLRIPPKIPPGMVVMGGGQLSGTLLTESVR